MLMYYLDYRSRDFILFFRRVCLRCRFDRLWRGLRRWDKCRFGIGLLWGRGLIFWIRGWISGVSGGWLTVMLLSVLRPLCLRIRSSNDCPASLLLVVAAPSRKFSGNLFCTLSSYWTQTANCLLEKQRTAQIGF